MQSSTMGEHTLLSSIVKAISALSSNVIRYTKCVQYCEWGYYTYFYKFSLKKVDDNIVGAHWLL